MTKHKGCADCVTKTDIKNFFAKLFVGLMILIGLASLFAFGWMVGDDHGRRKEMAAEAAREEQAEEFRFRTHVYLYGEPVRNAGVVHDFDGVPHE